MRKSFSNFSTRFTTLLQKRGITTLLLIANLCLLVLYVGGWSADRSRVLSAQANEKSVSKHFALKNEPLELVEIKVKNKTVSLGNKFSGEPDWLKYAAFKVKNSSSKPITFLQVDLDFPETKATGKFLMHQIFIGQHPDSKSTLTRPPLYLKPHESIEISLENEYADIKRLIELKGKPIGNINELVIRTGDVIFEDGTLYSGGTTFRRNPDANSPQKWISISAMQATSHNN